MACYCGSVYDIEAARVKAVGSGKVEDWDAATLLANQRYDRMSWCDEHPLTDVAAFRKYVREMNAAAAQVPHTDQWEVAKWLAANMVRLTRDSYSWASNQDPARQAEIRESEAAEWDALVRFFEVEGAGDPEYDREAAEAAAGLFLLTYLDHEDDG